MSAPREKFWARVTVGVGAVLFWAVVLALLMVVEMPITDSIVLGLLLVVLPAASFAQLPMIQGDKIERMPAYWGSIVTLWLLGSAAWLVGTRDGGNAAVGLVGLPVGAMLAWSFGLTAGALAIIVVFRQISIWMGRRDSPLLRQLLPRTPKERRVFVLLSVAAGTGEELAFRGYAIGALAPVLGTVEAAVLTSAVFGLLHAYQGALGMVRTGLMGGMLAAGFLVAGSLWPAIIAHVLIDVVAGVFLGDRLLSPESEPSPSGHGPGAATVLPTDPQADDSWK